MTNLDLLETPPLPPVDMSPEAIAQRIAEVAELLRVCLSLEEAGRALGRPTSPRAASTEEPWTANEPGR